MVTKQAWLRTLAAVAVAAVLAGCLADAPAEAPEDEVGAVATTEPTTASEPATPEPEDSADPDTELAEDPGRLIAEDLPAMPQEAWSVEFPGPGFHNFSAGRLSDDEIFVVAGQYLAALDVATGEQR